MVVSDIQSFHVAWFVTHDTQFDVTLRIGDGRLLGVESGRSVDAIDLGRVALIDGLVNAHTHLEFSGIAQPIPTAGRFTDWIRAVIAHRRAHPANVGEAVRAGLCESLESGTTLLGDIATSGWSSQDYAASQIPGIVFQEILGLLPDRIDEQRNLASAHQYRIVTPLSAGISPHAPYSTHLDLVHEAVDLARKTGCPLAMHLAETQAELELLAQGTGEFRELLTELGIWRDDPSAFGKRPMDYLEILSQAPRALVIHGNFLEEDELQFIAARPHMTLVYCPRTHAAFGHSDHPWRRLLEQGGQVALGTDSRASNPDLSLFAELQFLASQNPEHSHLDLLQLGSSAGRIALGLGGSDRANFTLVRLGDSSLNDPQRHLFAQTNRVCGTMVNGRWVWRQTDQSR